MNASAQFISLDHAGLYMMDQRTADEHTKISVSLLQ